MKWSRSLGELSGKRFGLLVVVKRAQQDGKRVFWECKCDCGKTVIKPARRLTTSNKGPNNCGCLKKGGSIPKVFEWTGEMEKSVANNADMIQPLALSSNIFDQHEACSLAMDSLMDAAKIRRKGSTDAEFRTLVRLLMRRKTVNLIRFQNAAKRNAVDGHIRLDLENEEGDPVIERIVDSKQLDPSQALSLSELFLGLGT